VRRERPPGAFLYENRRETFVQAEVRSLAQRPRTLGQPNAGSIPCERDFFELDAPDPIVGSGDRPAATPPIEVDGRGVFG